MVMTATVEVLKFSRWAWWMSQAAGRASQPSSPLLSGQPVEGSAVSDAGGSGLAQASQKWLLNKHLLLKCFVGFFFFCKINMT